MNLPQSEIDAISNLGLAHMGDCVFEILCRGYLCAQGEKTVGQLHHDTIQMVKATSQAKFADKLLPLLTDEELAEEQEMTEQLRAADQKTAEEENQDEFEIPDLEEEGTEQVSFNTVDLQNLVRGEETEEIPEAVEETEIVEEAAAEETAEEVTEETEETESAEPETVEEIE